MNANTTLVTGYPNPLCRALVEALAANQEGPGEVCLLVAEANQAEGEMFRSGVLGGGAGLRLLAGDVSAIDFGLSGPDYLELARRTRVIHHFPTLVNPGAPRGRAESIIVGGAREIGEFTKVAVNLERLVLHSTAWVAGDRTGVVKEDELARGQDFRSETGRSLAISERIVTQIKGAPVIVLRPSLPSADSRTGQFDRDGLFGLLVGLFLNSPYDLPALLPHRGEVPFNVVPVDYVARAALALTEKPDAVGKTFHLTDPNPLTVEQVFHLLRSAARARGTGASASGLGRALFTSGGPWSWTRTPRVLVELLGRDVRYDTSNTDAVLGSSPIACPPFASYLDRLLDYHFLPPPKPDSRLGAHP